MTHMQPHLRCAVAVGFAAITVAGSGAEPQSPGTNQIRPGVFRSGVELITVDVHVVGSDGAPVSGLDLRAFEVTIDGRKRRVVSADFVALGPAGDGTRSAPATPPPVPVTPASSATVPHEPPPPAPRIFMLAIDCASFDAAMGKPVLAAAAAFIGRTQPNDLVGLFAYPVGPLVDPTTDHAAVVRALDKVMPQADRSPFQEFNLSPSDLVELSRLLTPAPTDRGVKLQEQLCGDDALCIMRLTHEIQGSQLYWEGMAEASIGMLRGLMKSLGGVPGRKTLVLVSAGLVSGDMPGSRPDNHQLGILAGKAAAEANVSVYTLFLDQSWLRLHSAETRRARNSLVDVSRDSNLLGKWLDEFSGTAGGTLVKVMLGDGEFAFDRIIRETSAYYLLGVEPTDAERDGRPHELKVKVSGAGRGATVRGRSWVVIPKPGSVVAARPVTGRVADAEIAAPSAMPPSPEVRALADLFDRGDDRAFAQALAAPTALGVIAAFREGSSPWPDSPRRTAVFAQQLAMATLRTGSSFVLEEALKLLVEYGARVRSVGADTAFECEWLRAEVAGLEGLNASRVTTHFIARAVDRCPADPYLRLAAGVVADQDLLQSAMSSVSPTRGRREMTAEERRVSDLYETAATFPETRHEARLRHAWLHYRVGQFAEGLTLMDGLVEPDDPYLVYLGRLFKGQLQAAAGQSDSAVATLRSAMAAWPGAQAARVSLMTLLVTRGDIEGALALAERIQTAPATDRWDPWWTYWLGDLRHYGDRQARLRAITR